MSTWTDANILADLVDRQFDHVLSAANRQRQFLLLPRLLAFLRREPRLAGLIDDIEREAVAEVKHLTARDLELRAVLKQLWQRHGVELRERLADVDDDALHAYCHMDRYDGALDEAAVVEFPTSIPLATSPSKTATLRSALAHWCKWVLDVAEREEHDDQLGRVHQPRRLRLGCVG